MSKRRKDVTFDGDINKGGSSDRVEDPNQINNNQNNVSDSNTDNENSLNQDSNDNNQSHPEKNTNNEEDDNQHADEGTSHSKSEDNSNNVTDPSNHSVGNNGGDKVTESPSQQQENDNLNDYPSSSDDNSNQTDDSHDDDSTNQFNNNDSNSVSNNNEDDDNNQNDAKDDKTFNTEDSDEGKTFSPEENDDESDKSGIVGKALGISDAASTLSKAKKLKDISEMSKEEAKEQFQSMAVEAGKMKIKAALWSAVSPYLLPIIGIILVIVLVFTMIVGIVGSSSSGGGGSKQGCKVVKDNSTDVKNSKDADKNAETIYKYLMEHVDGAKSKAVAAHLGNIYVESAQSFDPSTIQGGEKYKEDIAMDPDAGGYAFGISQWDSERRVNLIKYAKKKDKKWDDLGVQLDYMLNHDGSDSETIKKLLKSGDEIDESTENIMNEWERAGDKSSIGERRSAAAKYYSKFNDKDTKSGEDSNIDDTTDAATDNSDAAENSGCEDEEDTDGNVGKSVKANGDSGEIKEKWSSKDEIPKKYKKYIKIPEFKDSFLEGSPFGTSTKLKGQCTELTWAYMSAMWSGKQPTSGNGGDLHKSYKSAGAKVTSNPTVGYGFSSSPPYAGAGDGSLGHTGVVAGVLPDGKWILANYNLNLEAPDRKLTYALVDGNKKEGGVKFFSGIGDKKKKAK